MLGEEGTERGPIAVVAVGDGRDDHIHGLIASPVCVHVGLDQADQALAVPRSVAVQHLVDLGPPYEEVDVVFPGEADAPVQLQRLATEMGKGVVDVGPGGGHRLGCVGQTVAERQGGVVRCGPHALQVHQEIGQTVLDRLEAADGPAELHALLGVLHGRREDEIGGTDRLGRLQHRGHSEAALHHGPSARELCRDGNGDIVEAHLGKAAGQVEDR